MKQETSRHPFLQTNKKSKENIKNKQNIRTWSGCDCGVEKRNRGVNKQRITRDQKPDNPVSYLVKTGAGDDQEKLFTLVEQYFEQNGDQPEKQSGHKKNSCLVLINLFWAYSCHWRRTRSSEFWILLIQRGEILSLKEAFTFVLLEGSLVKR